MDRIVKGVTVVLYFQSVWSYYGHYLHSEQYRAEQALCDGRFMLFLSCVALWHCAYENARVYLQPPLWPSLFLLFSACPGFFPILFDPLPPLFILASLILVPHTLHLLHPPPSTSSPPEGFRVPLIPFPCSSSSPTPHLLRSILFHAHNSYCCNPLSLPPVHTHPVFTTPPMSVSPPFLTALGKLVDLVSPACTQWSPNLLSRQQRTQPHQFHLWKELKHQDWRRARRMTFFLIRECASNSKVGWL